jgi:LPXTG-motif cell wall-anchored protein
VGEEQTYTINYIFGLSGDGKSDGGSTGNGVGGGTPSLASVLRASSILAFGGTEEEVLGIATTSAKPTPTVSPAQIEPNPVSNSANWVLTHKKISLLILLILAGLGYYLYRKRKNF